MSLNYIIYKSQVHLRDAMYQKMVYRGLFFFEGPAPFWAWHQVTLPAIPTKPILGGGLRWG